MCLSKPGKVTVIMPKTQAYIVICPFSLHYESLLFYSTDPWNGFRMDRMITKMIRGPL